ncbi:MAG: hypothetical protein L0G27_03205 [Paracoccus sp. (in: a-proteobacteria)]|nr:hypothetical protein [Paracoccus sp. (in: a-proteobacteria)]
MFTATCQQALRYAAAPAVRLVMAAPFAAQVQVGNPIGRGDARSEAGGHAGGAGITTLPTCRLLIRDVGKTDGARLPILLVEQVMHAASRGPRLAGPPRVKPAVIPGANGAGPSTLIGAVAVVPDGRGTADTLANDTTVQNASLGAAELT